MKFTQFEQASRQEQSRDYIHPAVQHAHKKALETLHESEINPYDFTHLYKKEDIDRDMAGIERKEKGFAKDANKVYAEVLEAVMYHQIGHGDWFGKRAKTIKPTLYDDVYNNCDLILELEGLSQKLSHLSLSIDVTFGVETEEKKFAAIKKNIDEEKLGKIKYFNTGDGALNKVPQVVIGVEKELVVRLAGLWSDDSNLKEKSDITLRDHPVQRVILAEILMQLNAYRRYSEETGKDSLVPIYEKSIGLVEDIMREKGPISMGEFADDKVFEAIRKSLAIFKISQ